MTLYLLDTNIASAAIRGVEALDRKLGALEPGDWAISAVTRAELRYGVALKPQAVRLASLVAAFLDTAWTLSWDEGAADRHGQIRAHLRTLGSPIGPFDEMIAAHALSLGAVLVTDNARHFVRVPELRWENWLR